jgi:hypothetical protein
MGLFLAVSGVVLLAASGLLWRYGSPEVARIAASSAALEDSLTRVHARLVKTSIKYRGLLESESSIPDTVRVFGAGQMMKLGASYDKAIRKLEMEETDIKIEMASLKRDAERQHAAAKHRALPLAGAGAAAFLIGLVLTALPSRRVDA